MANKIKFKRGLKANLSTLEAGEPAFLTDTNELVIGSDNGNVNIGGSGGGNNPYEFSTTPVQIGTWIDGTPVWRLALPFILMKNGVRGVTVNSNTNTISVNLRNYIINTVLHGWNGDFICYLGGMITWYDEYEDNLNGTSNDLWFTMCKDNAALFESYIEFCNGWWGGYIDFVARAGALQG